MSLLYVGAGTLAEGNQTFHVGCSQSIPKKINNLRKKNLKLFSQRNYNFEFHVFQEHVQETEIKNSRKKL